MYELIVGVKIGYDEINVRKLPEQIFSSVKIEISQKTKKKYQRSNGQLVGTAELDQPQIQLGRSPSWTSPIRRTTELN